MYQFGSYALYHLGIGLQYNWVSRCRWGAPTTAGAVRCGYSCGASGRSLRRLHPSEWAVVAVLEAGEGICDPT